MWPYGISVFQCTAGDPLECWKADVASNTTNSSCGLENKDSFPLQRSKKLKYTSGTGCEPLQEMSWPGLECWSALLRYLWRCKNNVTRDLNMRQLPYGFFNLSSKELWNIVMDSVQRINRSKNALVRLWNETNIPDLFSARKKRLRYLAP